MFEGEPMGGMFEGIVDKFRVWEFSVLIIYYFYLDGFFGERLVSK